MSAQPKRVVLTAEAISWLRMYKNGVLERKFSAVDEVASQLFGIQSQELPWAGINAKVRMSRSWTHKDMLRRVYTAGGSARRPVELWGQRGTLHVYSASDWHTLVSALGHEASTSWYVRRMVAKEGKLARFLTQVDAIEKELRSRSLSRTDLVQLLPKDCNPRWAARWVFFDLVYRGDGVHCGWSGRHKQLAHRINFLPTLRWGGLQDPVEANQRLILRYLDCYGPATMRDFCHWRGCKVTHAREWWSQTLAGSKRHCIVSPAGTKPDAELWTPCTDLKLLQSGSQVEDRSAWPNVIVGCYDSLVLAHADKSWFLDMRTYKQVWRKAAYVAGVIMSRGVIVGTWKYLKTGSPVTGDGVAQANAKGKKRGFIVQVSPFWELPHDVESDMRAMAASVAAYWDSVLLAVDFLPPMFPGEACPGAPPQPMAASLGVARSASAGATSGGAGAGAGAGGGAATSSGRGNPSRRPQPSAKRRASSGKRRRPAPVDGDVEASEAKPAEKATSGRRSRRRATTTDTRTASARGVGAASARTTALATVQTPAPASARALRAAKRRRC